MGLTSELMQELIGLKRQGMLGNPKTVAEIGAQQLSDEFLLASDAREEIYRVFATVPVDIGHTVGPENFSAQAPPSRPFWRSLGLDYLAIDLVGADALKLDLNRDSVPPALRHTRDLVVNWGSTEHVANQDNAFRVIHDLTKLGGMMLHFVPSSGLMTHGLVNCTMRFFWHLCRENRYEVITLRTLISPEIPLERNVIEANIHLLAPCPPPADRATTRTIIIQATLRKIEDRPFETPLDLGE
jgi:hypothetical protein